MRVTEFFTIQDFEMVEKFFYANKNNGLYPGGTKVAVIYMGVPL